MNCLRLLGILILIGLISCQPKDKPASSRLRIISMIPNTDGTLSIQRVDSSGAKSREFSLGYQTSIQYMDLQPGYYKLKYTIGDKPLLDGTYVMGKNGYYTLLLTGLQPDSIRPNPKTTLFTIEEMVAGSEATGTNGYLPRWFLLRDNYDGNLNHAYVRVINASSMYNSVRVKKKKADFAHVPYPMETEMKELAPGRHSLSFYYGEIKVAEKEISTQQGYIYTLIIGNPAHQDGKAEIELLENASRMLMHSRKNK